MQALSGCACTCVYVCVRLCVRLCDPSLSSPVGLLCWRRVSVSATHKPEKRPVYTVTYLGGTSVGRACK